MKLRLLIAVTATAALGLATMPAHATHSRTASYLIGATPGVSVVCCGGALGPVMQENNVGIGGFQFPAVNESVVQLQVRDTTADRYGIGYTVCQVIVPAGEGEPPKSCGDGGTVSFGGCTPANGNVALTGKGLVKNIQTAVFIRMADPACDGGVASSGTVTLKYGT
jgi:hypothetical protein